MTTDPYAGREQALVKHTVLKAYLQALAFKLAFSTKDELTINYVDGFSGPWQQATEDLSDTSPGIALQALDEVRVSMSERGRLVRIRCLFVEKDEQAHREPTASLARFPGIETEAICGTFEESIPAVARFAAHGKDAFAFVFIDPTGWTGFALQRLKPIFPRRSEVLVNFMTKDIRRFLADPACAPSLRELFGGDAYRACVDQAGLDREDCLVETYCRAVERTLGFGHCTCAIVLNPSEDRTLYHLIYATNSVYGLDAFREAEAKAMTVQRAARGTARHRDQQQREPGQTFLLPPNAWGSTYADELAARYSPRARQAMADQLRAGRVIAYDRLVEVVLRYPMVTRSALNDWLDELRTAGTIEYVGLTGKARRPRLGEGHQIAVKA